MDADAYDATAHCRQFYAEDLWLRELLTKAAQDLEQLSSERSAEFGPLLRRAMRIRELLHAR